MTDSFDYDLVCIGSGPAGQRAAVQAAKIGRKVAVVEKTDHVGGVCIEAGTVPSKSLREAVLRVVASGREPAPGELRRHVQDIVRHESILVRDQLRRNGVEIVHGAASFLDPHTIAIDAREGRRALSARFILIAVGSRSVTPPGVAPDDPIIVTSDTLLDVETRPGSMAVVGAGVIGVEYACMAAALGIQTTVIDQRDHVLDFMDHELTDELVRQMRDMKITLLLGEKVKTMEASGERTRRATIALESGKRVTAEMVLYSAGRQGAVEGLNLEAAGLAADTRGRLTVDQRFRTAVEHIYAAGDVIGHPALAATSAEQGRLAACDAFNFQPRPLGATCPVGIYAIPELSMVGRTQQELLRDGVPHQTGVARYDEIARGQILGDRTGLFKLIFHRDDKRLLGVHAIGTGATELIHTGQAVMSFGGGLDYFLNTVFNYPTLTECYKVAALNAHNKFAAG
jgi:NAD(P) transhydrogenase